MARMFRTGDLVRIRYYNATTKRMETSDAFEVLGWRHSDSMQGERLVHLIDCAPFHHIQASRELILDTACE